ncbi:DNA polymerase III, alpha subunit [Xylanimonas cellulosilytica DSM 15894]|uniref:Error-prone DNA polymerase n=1 Tax=Xylanimonas cellulosilytica (strain DSM 15894 / JCM 12276 / CECT 5975 / KCTC 9989 / LMG 20990 / NBRC 107835 / XIL07) TaxID=446471 RepID=D1BRY0_XYLCX|nr:error-prone DNA polymerase [Xylanimonas cellulosilytica]ACZ30472.1 DNA polymerase III, alpha subunit [Xylanimonas cellulosilytica DSM 15894]
MTDPSPRYAELHAHSSFSFLDGASHPEELAAEAARLGLSALAVTDHDGLYGVVRHSQTAASVRLRTVFGAELHLPVPPGPGVGPRPVLDPPTGIPDPRAEHLLVLARGADGYARLSSAIAAAHLEAGVKGKATYHPERLGEQAAGEWLVLTGCRKGSVRRALAAEGTGGARRELDRLVALFGHENVAVEITATGDPRDADLHDALATLAHDARLPLVATTNAHYARPRDAHLAQALAAVRATSSLEQMDGWLPGAPTAHLRSGAEMARLHHRHPHSVPTAAALADECAFDLRLVAPGLPPYPVPEGHDEASWLRELVYRGATDRYGPRHAERIAGAWAQLDHELAVIEGLDFPGYFLVVYDLVEFCRVHGILAQGRGSAANSAVCYALGITAVDAVKNRLLFERFLAPERDGPPDIDIDIESVRREEVIQHVYTKFGRSHAAQVANVISYRPRSAVRDAARALGYDVGQQDAWSKSIERWGSLRDTPKVAPAVETRAAVKDARGAAVWGNRDRDWTPSLGYAPPRVVDPLAHDDADRPARPADLEREVVRRTTSRGGGEGLYLGSGSGSPERSDDAHDVVPAHAPPSAADEGTIPEQVIDLAERFLRLPRHLGIHSGGMVMCDRPVIEVCPVEWARMEGRTVLQWDKEDCADAGLVKFDLLGLGMLTAIRYAFEGIEARTGERLQLHHLPEDDPAVYDLLCAADTVGVFQVESRAQMATLPRLRPRNFYDIVVEVALIRPGPIQGNSVNPFIERRNKRQKVTYPHPLLEKSLSRTLGVPLFQEQLMQMAIDVAGFSPAESDRLRRAMGSKRSLERMEALRGRLMEGMTKNGVPPDVQEEIYGKLKAFADFGFPESHAYSFAFLVYASSWLKVHHPAAFYAGLLAAQPMGFYSPQSLVADARRHGVTVLRPDLGASAALACVERLPDDAPLEPERIPLPRSPDPRFGPDPDLRLAVRQGLAEVRSIGTDLAESIVAERSANGPFRDLRDLVRRVDLTTPQLEALATAGATESLGVGRREALWAAGALGQEGPDTLEGVSVGVEAPTLPGMSDVETTVADSWATGVTPGLSPVELVRDSLTRAGVVTVGRANVTEDGRRIAVGGVITHRQRPGTAGGVTFLSVEDETGLLNVVCSPGLWQRFRTVARTASAMVVRGRIEKADGATNLVAEHLSPLRLPVTTRSRDFR